MKLVEIKGIIPPIVTPMNEDESINIQGLRDQVERQIAAGDRKSTRLNSSH